MMKLIGQIDRIIMSVGISRELGRFLVNGVIATLIHFTILTVGIEVLHIKFAAVSNFIAALFGITCSFFGNRYYVFRKTSEPLLAQAWKFALLYLVIALFHGAFLLVWTDWLGNNYRIGFVIATAIQITATFLGARGMVFSK